MQKRKGQLTMTSLRRCRWIMGCGAADGDGCRCDDDGVLVIGEHADASRRVMTIDDE